MDDEGREVGSEGDGGALPSTLSCGTGASQPILLLTSLAGSARWLFFLLNNVKDICVCERLSTTFFPHIIAAFLFYILLASFM